MIKKLKRERTALIVCLVLSMILHIAYGLEGAAQVQALEHQIERQAAQLKDKEQQIEILEIIIENKDQDESDIEVINEPELKIASEFEITYYCSCYECCGKTDGITASGTLAQEGITVAADWDMLPSGTKIYIDGIGCRTVEDKGGAIKGNRLDVYMNSHAAALEAGRHNADVWIIVDDWFCNIYDGGCGRCVYCIREKALEDENVK